MPDPVMLANRYIASWNETDSVRRRDLLAELWTEDATYVDPLMQGTGPGQIDALVAAVHERFPGFRFVLDGRVDGFEGHLRFSWGLGPEGADSVVKGTDFVLLEGD